MLIRAVSIILVCLFFTPKLYSQGTKQITGVVVEGATEKPISNASVFLSNTSIGTITAADGSFRLGDIPEGNYDLVVSSIGFATQVYHFSTSQLPLRLKVLLESKATEFETVVVEPFEKDGWKNWGNFFLGHFIGTTQAAARCRIVNQKALRFRHSKKTDLLTVTAIEPLVIENRELGYRITYQLEEFTYNFKERTLFYLGFTLFKDLAGDSNKIPKRYLRARKKAYHGSIIHFTRSIFENAVAENGFQLRRMYRTPNVEKERVRGLFSRRPDSTEYYQRILAQPDHLDRYSPYLITADSLIMAHERAGVEVHFSDHIEVTYLSALEEPGYLQSMMERRRAPSRQRSFVVLKTGSPVFIDRYGICDPPTEFFVFGYWAWSEKISHLLPFDFDPEKGR